MTTSSQWRDAANGLREMAAKWDEIAARDDPWLVPVEHRPLCTLTHLPCTSWTCLVDSCGEQ